VSVNHQPHDTRAEAAAQERLRQFLQWRQETGRAPQPRLTGKPLLWVGLAGVLVGTAVAGVLVLSPVTRLRPEVQRAPAAVVAAPTPPVSLRPRTRPGRVDATAEAWREAAPGETATEAPPELPPRSARRLTGPMPADRQPPRVPQLMLPSSDLPVPPVVEPSPAAPEAPPPVTPGVESVSSPRSEPSMPSASPSTDAPPALPAAVPAVPPASIAPPAGALAPSMPVNPPVVGPDPTPSLRIERLTMPSPQVVRPTPSGPAPSVETLKRLAGYIPEVWLARKVAAWVKTMPAPDGGPPPESESVQAR
jgi:hypothetical protein